MVVGTDDLSNRVLREVQASRGEEAATALHALLTKARADGEPKEALLAVMQELRGSVSEEQEDLLLDGMDWLAGWCHPDWKIA
jgi:hypothetical protein